MMNRFQHRRWGLNKFNRRRRKKSKSSVVDGPLTHEHRATDNDVGLL